MSNTILVTGASGGFGQLIVNTLLKEGHTVVGTMRGVEGRNAETAETLRSAGANVVELDVTSDESVSSGIAAAIEAVGELDIVINNAGVGVMGLIETFTPEDWKNLFEINVFGVQRVNREVLPAMRSRGSGLLILVSSLLGRMTVPFYGPYNASKWALEALAENYRTELSAFGVQSVLVEPGGYPTTFMDHLVKPGDTSRDESYGDLAQAPAGFLAGFEEALAANPAQNPRDVADAIAELIAMPKAERPYRTVVDKMGMGDHIKPYNEGLHQLTAGIYGAFGIDDMLTLPE